jgi:uncharacterized SAM-binding protein YcdF (DUF218 family)
MRNYFIILLVITCFQSCFFIGPSAQKRLQLANKPYDVIIIPGLPLYNGKIDTLLKARLLWSKFLYDNNYTTHIIYSGNAVYTNWIEGKAMALMAQQLQIKPQHILVDTLAEHSTENLFYSYQLAKQKGFTKIAVATDPFQCAMLFKFAKKNIGEPIYFFPLIYDSIKKYTRINLQIDTNTCKKINFVAINKRQGYGQRLKGTRGKQIKK